MENKKQLFITRKGVIDTKSKKLLGVIGSDGTVDRYGESVNPMGWLVKNFTKNPVILFGHNYSDLPVGKAERVYIEDNALKFDIEFADTAFASDVFKLFEQKILNAFSVGFVPKKWGVSGQDAYDIMEQELLELSVVTVPANPNAVAELKSFEGKYKKELNIKGEDGEEPLKPNETAEVEPVEETPVETPTEEITEEKPNDEKVEDTPVEDVPTETNPEDNKEELPEGEQPSEEKPAEEVPTEEKPVEEKPEEQPEGEDKEFSPKALDLLKEISNCFKKADNATGTGLALLKKLKSELSVKN